jgi:hypothetical protein
MNTTPKTVWVQTNGQNYRGNFPDLNYQQPVEVDAALLPMLLALEGVVEVASPIEAPANVSTPESEPLPEIPATVFAPETPKE